MVVSIGSALVAAEEVPIAGALWEVGEVIMEVYNSLV